MPGTQHEIQVAALLEFENLLLTVRAGQEGLHRPVKTHEINRPAMELIGYVKEFRPERMQIVGRGESSYILDRAGDSELLANLRAMFQAGIPCMVATYDRRLPEAVEEMADECDVPLLTTPLPTSRFVLRVSENVERVLAPRIAERGVLMDIHGVGVLIAGQSGVGKSECALELVSRGHTFVADDMVQIRTHQESVLIGSGFSIIPHHMEIRGVGIIDINRLFGPRATRQEKQVDLVVTLEDWDDDTEYDRLGIDEETTEILGIEIPRIQCPVRPGRNVATVIEVSALNQKLKASGVYMAREFDQKLIQEMMGGGA